MWYPTSERARSISQPRRARRLHLRFPVLPDPPRPLRWVSSEMRGCDTRQPKASPSGGSCRRSRLMRVFPPRCAPQATSSDRPSGGHLPLRQNDSARSSRTASGTGLTGTVILPFPAASQACVWGMRGRALRIRFRLLPYRTEPAPLGFGSRMRGAIRAAPKGRTTVSAREPLAFAPDDCRRKT